MINAAKCPDQGFSLNLRTNLSKAISLTGKYAKPRKFPFDNDIVAGA